MKDKLFYFSHDFNTRADNKIKKLVQQTGMTGYGIFWAIIEDLYNNQNRIPLDFKLIAFELRVDNSLVEDIILNYELFTINKTFFSSTGVKQRLAEIKLKSEKAKESANKRWIKPTDDANALRTECDSNAIKEKKEKENKVNNIKENKEDIYKKEKEDQIIKETIPIQYSSLLELRNSIRPKVYEEEK